MPSAVMASVGLVHPEIRLDLHNPLSRGYVRGRPLWVIVLWDLVQHWLIHTSPHFAFGWRRFWWRVFGAKVGKGVRIGHNTVCHYPWKVTLGDNVWLGDGANLYSMDRITIEDHAVVSQGAYICTGTHDPKDPTFPVLTRPVTIRRGAWVTLNAVVLPGVTVGTGAIVGVGAVLTKDAEDWGVYLGVPARRKCARHELS